MRPVECEFESEVLAAALEGRWPEHVSGSLAAHAAGCPICSDVAAVAPALHSARGEASEAIVIPDSARVWWIAQLRARREAAKAAGRPITAAQVIALGCALGLFGGCFGLARDYFTPVAQLLAGHSVLVLAAAAVFLLILPAAVCYAMLKD